MKIYLCGARSTGKSTLAKKLAEALCLPLIDGVAREVGNEFELGTMEAQEAIISEYTNQFTESHEFVSSRSYFDIYAHTLVILKKEKPDAPDWKISGLAREATSSLWYNTLGRNVCFDKKPRLLFFLPIVSEIPMVGDKSRGYDGEERMSEQNQMLQAMFRRIYDGALIPVRFIGKISPNDRYEEAMNAIKGEVGF